MHETRNILLYNQVNVEPCRQLIRLMSLILQDTPSWCNSMPCCVTWFISTQYHVTYFRDWLQVVPYKSAWIQSTFTELILIAWIAACGVKHVMLNWYHWFCEKCLRTRSTDMIWWTHAHALLYHGEVAHFAFYRIKHVTSYHIKLILLISQDSRWQASGNHPEDLF